MGCTSNNATPASPAIAPGAAGIDPRRVAERLVREHGAGGMHPRVRALVPDFDAPFFQAGLAGYSDAAMRIIARRHGCPYCVTEALLDRTLLAGGRGFAKADLGELHDNVPGGEEDRPLAGQIMGSDPAEMGAGALKMVEQGRRHEREYRRLAYAGAAAPGVHLRLPGGEQLGRIDLGSGLAGSDGAGSDEAGSRGVGPDLAGAVRPYGVEGVGPVLGHAVLGGGLPGDRRGSSGAPPAGDRSSESFAAIDVNLACPVKKISSKARGGHWLAEPEGAIAILEAVRDAVPAGVLCTLKIRRSFDDTPEMVENFWRIFDAAYAMGYAWATVHARTVEQKYIGPSRWDVLRGVVERARRSDPDRPVFGSGDVWEVGDIFRMVEYTGVSGASVARGCIGNPWIFRQARDLLAGREAGRPSIAEQRTVLEAHFDLAMSVNAGMRQPEVYTGRVMRKFGIRFAEHHPRAEEVRREFIRVASLEDWRAVLDSHYAGGD